MPTLSKADKKIKVSQVEADRRRTLALARLRELELAEKQGKLIDRSKVEREWFEHGRLIRDAFLGIPARLGSLLASISDPHQIHQLLDAELRKALNEVADTVTVH